MGLEVGSEILDSYMKLDDPPYKGMQMFLLTEDQVLYSADGRKTGLPYRMDQDRVVINDEGHSYAGVRSILQLYGHMESGAVYIAQVADQSELSALSKDTVMMIDRPPGEAGLHQDLHRIWKRRGHPGGCEADEGYGG